MTDVRVTDHAVLRYLERVVGLDVEALRAAIGADCHRAQGAPSVNVGIARYIVRGGIVVTVLDGRTVPAWDFLRRIQRGGASDLAVREPHATQIRRDPR